MPGKLLKNGLLSLNLLWEVPLRWGLDLETERKKRLFILMASYLILYDLMMLLRLELEAYHQLPACLEHNTALYNYPYTYSPFIQQLV